jgi:hypothetical protein
MRDGNALTGKRMAESRSAHGSPASSFVEKLRKAVDNQGSRTTDRRASRQRKNLKPSVLHSNPEEGLIQKEQDHELSTIGK